MRKYPQEQPVRQAEKKEEKRCKHQAGPNYVTNAIQVAHAAQVGLAYAT